MNLKLKITLVLTLLIMGLLVVFYLNLGKIIGHFINPDDIANFIREKNGLEVKISGLKIKTGRNLGLHFDNLEVLTPEKKELLALEQSSLKIEIFPLVTKKITIKSFNSSGARANIYRDKLGKFELEKYFNSDNKMDFKFELNNARIAILHYEINLQDDCEKIKSKFLGENFEIMSAKDLLELKTKGTSGIATYELDLKTKLPIKKHLSDKSFKFNVNVKNFDFSPYSGYLNQDINGVFNIQIDTNGEKIYSDISIDNFSILDEKYDVKSPSTIKISSLALVKSNFIEIEKMKVQNSDFTVETVGKILNYKTDDTKFDLKIDIKNAIMKGTIALLPNLIPTPEDSIRKLKKYAVDGAAKGQLELKGSAKKPEINGRVDIVDITLFNRTLKIPPSHGYVEFLGDKIYVDARALLALGKYVDVKGTAEFYGKREGSFHISSTKNLDLEQVMILLLPIRDMIGFKLGPVPYMEIAGSGSVDLKTSGSKKNAKLNGYLDFQNVTASIEGLKFPLTKGVGKISFKNDKILFNGITAKLFDADLKIDGAADISGNVAMNFSSKNLSNNDAYLMLEKYLNKDELKKFAFLKDIKFTNALNLGFKSKFKSDGLEDVNLEDLNFYGSVSGVNSKNSDVIFNSGQIYLKNNKIFVDKLDVTCFGANIFSDFTVDKIFASKTSFNPVVTGKIVLKSFPLDKLNDIAANFKNQSLMRAIANFEKFQGEISGQLNIVKNNMSAKLALDSISFVDKAKNLPIQINSGSVEIKNNKLVLDALNMNYGAIPIYFSANVNDVTAKKPFIDARFSTSLSENDVDKIINANLLYPIKVKGEVSIRGMLKGYQDNYNIYSKIKLNPQSDISYMGANFGDIDLNREVKTSLNFSGNVAKVNNFEYLRYVSSQNNRLTPMTMLRAWGEIVLDNNKAALRDFNIKTSNPTTARIFNVMFRKSILKQGQFNCDLVLNGYYDNLKMLGSIDFTDVDIPLYESKIRDAQLNFTGNTIFANLAGKGFESDVKVAAEIQNNIKLPVVVKKVDINSSKINIGKIIDDLSALSAAQKTGTIINSKEQIVLNPKDIIVENGEFKAAEVNLYDIKATNFSGKYNHLPNSGFKFYDTVFDIAGGKIVSEGNFDFETTKLTLNSKIQNCEANSLSQSFLGISNQLYGIAKGEISLSGSQLHTAKGLQTVAAQAMFSVDNGKMPRLGSMEYLLRAGNIYKSGILGLSLNNIIEVLIPYKTGEFDTIRGNLFVQSGVIEKLEIFSKGENLSIFVHGKYDLNNDAADIEVLGRLSKKVSNLLGPVGNASFNSLLNILGGQKSSKISENELVQNINKIPLIEISQDDYRIFQVKITGDLNKEGYVKTFNWLN